MTSQPTVKHITAYRIPDINAIVALTLMNALNPQLAKTIHLVKTKTYVIQFNFEGWRNVNYVESAVKS